MILRWVVPLFAGAILFAQTPKRPVTTEYHGVKVTEDYRWLGKSNKAKILFINLNGNFSLACGGKHHQSFTWLHNIALFNGAGDHGSIRWRKYGGVAHLCLNTAHIGLGLR